MAYHTHVSLEVQETLLQGDYGESEYQVLLNVLNPREYD